MLGPLVLALALSSPIRFPNSGAPAAQGPFLRGVTALHNFQYEDAVDAFGEAQRLDRDFALACWGEAMAYNQTLWLNEDVAKSREILGRLGPTPAARAAKAPTEREKGFLRALEALVGDGDRAARNRAYADEMSRLAAAYPDDSEVLSFQALALMGTAARSPALFRDGGDDQHQHALVGSDVQKRAAAILDKVLAKHPTHPGALHYLIHNYDDPEHARLALPAARAYAKVAAQSSHALHMPAHIFLQLGLWDDAAASDEASFATSAAWVKRKGLGVGMRDYHSLSWLLYESLQQGRYRRARETLDLIAPAIQATGAAHLKGVQSDMRARYVVETRSFDELKDARNFGTNSELFAIGLSAARSGNAVLADMARNELGKRAEGQGRGRDVAVMAKELAAIIAVVAGHRDEAVARIREAVALERDLPPPLGPPRPIKPAAELSGEILLEVGRPKPAIESFTASLARWPNRSASVLGLARATAAAGDRAAAQRHYAAFLKNWRAADAHLPELREAREFK